MNTPYSDDCASILPSTCITEGEERLEATFCRLAVRSEGWHRQISGDQYTLCSLDLLLSDGHLEGLAACHHSTNSHLLLEEPFLSPQHYTPSLVCSSATLSVPHPLCHNQTATMNHVAAQAHGT